MVKVVVTGGSGFIGSHLVRALVEKGYDTHFIDLAEPSLPLRKKFTEKAKFHKIDLADVNQLSLLTEIFSGASCVFHLAALPRIQYSIDFPVESLQANVGGTLNVLNSAKAAGAKRVIFSSSSSIYGSQTKLPFTENMIPFPVSPYAHQKLTGEYLCKIMSLNSNLETVCPRLFNVYGPAMDPKGPYALAATKFIEQWRNKEPFTIYGDGSKTRDFTHVNDVVNFLIIAMDSNKVGKGEIVNVGRGYNVSVRYVAEIVGGRNWPIKYSPDKPNETVHTLADNTFARDMGWTPKVSIEEGIKEMKDAA